jgi:hypothetical protein
VLIYPIYSSGLNVGRILSVGGYHPFHLSQNIVIGRHYYYYCYYRGADKSLARPTSRCILFVCGNISFDASLVICINSTNIPPIIIINKIYEHQNLLSL